MIDDPLVTQAISESPPDSVLEIARLVDVQGGKLFLVGGWVRDAMRGAPSKDLDLEVYGIEASALTSLLRPFGFTNPVGRHFPVWRETRAGIDVSLPRADGAESWSGDEASLGRLMDQAARARDLTLNAMAWDPLANQLVDPLDGRADLTRSTLCAADAARFGDDPLRVYRVARLAALLDAAPDAELIALCRGLDLSALPPERIAAELSRILLGLPRPWLAIETLDALGQLSTLAPIAALQGVPQDSEWHPEGDVFVHTGMVVNCAAKRAVGLPAEEAASLLWAALCHDFGKATTTFREEDGRIRSPSHDVEGARVAAVWLSELRVGAKLCDRVAALVRHHLAPALFVAQKTKPKGYRRLARKLDQVGVTATELERVARADHLGRTTKEAREETFAAGDRFLVIAHQAEVALGVPKDIVAARDLMAKGVPAGPGLGKLLARCREIQDESDETDAERIISRLFAEVARLEFGMHTDHEA